MEEEQEGINLETINSPEDDGIVLPSVEESEEKEVEQDNETTDDSNNTKNDNFEDNKEKDDNLRKSLNYERKLRKQAEKEKKELESRVEALENASKGTKKTTLEELVESGVDENIAKSIVNAINSKDSNSDKIQKELADIKFKYELSEKSKNSNFSDIMDYEDDIKDLVNKGLNIEQAYYAINYDKSKSNNTKSEIEKKVEAKLQNNHDRKEILGNLSSNAGGAIKTDKGTPKATASEIAIARLAGMNINDYLAAKSSDSVKQYNSYLSKKVK